MQPSQLGINYLSPSAVIARNHCTSALIIHAHIYVLPKKSRLDNLEPEKPGTPKPASCLSKYELEEPEGWVVT